MVLVVGIGALAAMKFAKKAGSPTTEPGTPSPGGGGGTVNSGGGGDPPVAGTFPRRMLAISIHSYLYANPLHNGDTGFEAGLGAEYGVSPAVTLTPLARYRKIGDIQYVGLGIGLSLRP